MDLKVEVMGSQLASSSAVTGDHKLSQQVSQQDCWPVLYRDGTCAAKRGTWECLAGGVHIRNCAVFRWLDKERECL